MREDIDLGYKQAFKAIRRLGDLLSTSTDSVSQQLLDLDITYCTILDLGSSWGVSFLLRIEEKGAWWEEAENYKYSATDESLYKAVAKAYNLVVAAIEEKIKTNKKILDVLN